MLTTSPVVVVRDLFIFSKAHLLSLGILMPLRSRLMELLVSSLVSPEKGVDHSQGLLHIPLLPPECSLLFLQSIESRLPVMFSLRFVNLPYLSLSLSSPAPLRLR